jgi:hypothetical protein
LVFVKFNSLCKFNDIIKINDYKKISEQYGSEQINMPAKLLEDYNIYELDVKTIIKTIENFQVDDEESDESDESEYSDTSDSEEDGKNEEVINSVKMDIPILWAPCQELINTFSNKSIKKPIILSHYTKCEKCEITDNNKFPLEFDKKINLQIFNKSDQMTNLIYNYYQFAKKYSETEANMIELDFDENKINIIYYENPDDLYNKCIFVVKK